MLEYHRLKMECRADYPQYTLPRQYSKKLKSSLDKDLVMPGDHSIIIRFGIKCLYN
jgi:hypothetical protein